MEEDLENIIGAGVFPETIYKFRLWDDEPNDHIIRKRTIKLASPKEMLADYNEAYLPMDESLITEQNLQKHALYTAQTKYPTKHISYQKMMANKLRRRMKIQDPDHRKRAKSFALNRHDEVLGIFCATIVYEDFTLWERFAGLMTGFAVGLDTRKIVLHPLISGTAGLVEYYPRSNPPKLSPFSYSDAERIDKSMKEIFSVPEDYAFEKELRISRTNRKRDANGNILAYEDSDRIIPLSPDCFHEILLGEDISNSHKIEIIECRDLNLTDVPIYETKVQNNQVIRTNQL